MKLMFHLLYSCHLNKDVPLISKAFTHGTGWQHQVIFRLFCLAYVKQAQTSASWQVVLLFWVGSMTLPVVTALVEQEDLQQGLGL